MTFLLKLFSGARSLMSGLWGYLAVAGIAIATIVGAFLKGQQAAEDAIEAKQAKKARKVEKKVRKAHVKGVQRYEKSRTKGVDHRRVDQFERK